MTEKEIKIDNEITIKRFKLDNNKVIYYIVDEINGNIYDLYKLSTPFVEDKNNEVICYYKGYELVINKTSTLSELMRQYRQARDFEEFNNDLNKGLELQNIVFGLNKENAKKGLKKVAKILSEPYVNIPQYQLNYLSDSLLRLYRSTLPDAYFDSKIDEAKKFIKEK